MVQLAGSITSANAILYLTIANLYTAPQQIQGFSADDVYDLPQVRSAETMMGVDGGLAGGFIFAPIVQSFSLMANSPSIGIFDNWWVQQQLLEDVYIASGSITLNSLGKKWQMTGGFLTAYKPAPDARRVLQPNRYEVTWNTIVPAPSNPPSFGTA